MRRGVVGVTWLFWASFIAGGSSDAPPERTPKSVPALPLRATERHVVDAKGHRVKLSCVNWYGAQLKTYVQNGLSVRTAEQIAFTISEMGFNCVRLSYSVEAYQDNPFVRPMYLAGLTNSTDRRFLDVFDEVVAALTRRNLLVIINCHSSHAGWCCSYADGQGMWFNGEYTETDWIASLVGFARRYRENSLVVGFDLRNEVRPDIVAKTLPSWGLSFQLRTPGFRSYVAFDWRQAAERAGLAVLAADPDALIIVEVLFGMFLCPQIRYETKPLRGLDGHLVWSAHEYNFLQDFHSFAWVICGSRQDDTGSPGGDEAFALKYNLYSTLMFVQRQVEDLIFERMGTVLAGAALAATFIAVFFGLQGSGGLCCKQLSNFVVAMVTLGSLIWVISWRFLPYKAIQTYEDFVESRDLAWGWLPTRGHGPMWIGEFGENKPSLEWNWTIAYLRERDFDFAYWSLDGEHFPRAAYEFGEDLKGHWHEEVFGLLQTDYETIRDDWKLKDLQSIMAVTSAPRLARQAAPEVGLEL